MRRLHTRPSLCTNVVINFFVIFRVSTKCLYLDYIYSHEIKKNLKKKKAETKKSRLIYNKHAWWLCLYVNQKNILFFDHRKRPPTSPLRRRIIGNCGLRSVAHSCCGRLCAASAVNKTSAGVGTLIRN